MKIQKTGPDSVLVVLDRVEAEGHEKLRQKAFEALAHEGIAADELLEITAYTAGNETVVFVRADFREYTYFGFPCATELLEAAFEAQRLLPAADARLYRANGRFYIATPCRRAGELMREYSLEITDGGEFTCTPERLAAGGAFQKLTGG